MLIWYSMNFEDFIKVTYSLTYLKFNVKTVTKKELLYIAEAF